MIKEDRVIDTTVIILIIGLAILLVFLVFEPDLRINYSQVNRSDQEKSWPEQSGIQINKFDPLLSKIKADIKQEGIEIKVFLGPYFRYFGVTGILTDDYYPLDFILLDAEFYNQLTLEEQEALVAHEAGHILFRPSLEMGRHQIAEVQVRADSFAARYVHPKHLVSLLDKLYLDYLVRKKNLEELALSR